MRHSGKGPWLPNDTRFKLGIFLGEVSIFFSMREVGLIGLVLHESWSLGFSVEVQNHQLGLLCTVPRPNGTNLEKTQSNKYMKRLAETLVQHLEDIRPVKVCFQLGIMYNDNGRILTSLVGDERILQTTPPEPPDSSATRSRMKSPANKVNVIFFPQVFVVHNSLKSNTSRVQKHTCCDISHQFSRPRAWRCHRHCLWQRTWSWTEGTSQPTDAYWGLSWQMIIIFESGTVNEL